MNINRYNYEEYFLLYIDNELSLAERRALESFVEKNADLQKELLILQQSILKPDKNIVFYDKKALLRFTSDEQSININNYEQFFIYYLDDELSRHEKAAVEQFIYRHPEFQGEFELIQQLRLSPDSSVPCPDKKGLYRFEKEQPVILPWWRIAAAAVILFITATLWLNTQPFSKSDKPVAKHIIRTSPVLPRNEKNWHPQNGITVLPQNNPARIADRINMEKALPDKTLAGKKGYSKKIVESNAVRQAEVKVPMKPVIVETAALTSKEAVNTIMVSGKIGGLPAAGNLMNEPAPTDESTSTSYLVADASEARKNEHTFLTNIPIDDHGPLRKVFRKASRILDRTAALSSQRKSGIIIGNIEIALQ